MNQFWVGQGRDASPGEGQPAAQPLSWSSPALSCDNGENAQDLVRWKRYNTVDSGYKVSEIQKSGMQMP